MMWIASSSVPATAMAIPSSTKRRGAVIAFEARRDVDAVAEEVVFADQDVAEIDADAKFNAPLGWHTSASRGHFALHLDRATHRIDHAGEFDEQTLARRLNDTAAVFLYLRVSDLAPQCCMAAVG
jgi:hypothetical protein